MERFIRNSNYLLSHFFLGVTVIFYACFYAGLAILFSVCMKVMLATLSYEKPKWTLSNSLIGTNPGKIFIAEVTIACKDSLWIYYTFDVIVFGKFIICSLFLYWIQCYFSRFEYKIDIFIISLAKLYRHYYISRN